MKKMLIYLTLIVSTIVPVSVFAQVEPYLQTVSYAQTFNCSPGNAAWRLDEISGDAYGRYTDPYYYGYYDNAEVYGYNQLAQSQYSYNQPLMNDSSANFVVSPVYSNDTYSIAARNLASAQQSSAYVAYENNTGAYRTVVYPTNSSTYQLSRPVSQKPSCRLTPTYSDNNVIVLKWTTTNASTAFIDNGIGHVSLVSGSRAVTPNGSLTYTMTVVNEEGYSSQCMGKIIMEGKGDATIPGELTITTNGDSAANAQNLGVSAGKTVNDGLTTAANVAESTTNTISGFFSGLSSDGSVWDKIRSVSLVAIVLIVILSIMVFVMRTVFGGGGEGGH